MALPSEEDTLTSLDTQQERLADETANRDDVLNKACDELESYTDHAAICADALLSYRPLGSTPQPEWAKRLEAIVWSWKCNDCYQP